VQDLGENEVIHCPTWIEAEAICKLMHDAGLKWGTGTSYLEINRWEDYKENTCYRPYGCSYGSLKEEYQDPRYTIHPASAFLPASFYEDVVSENKEVNIEYSERAKKVFEQIGWNDNAGQPVKTGYIMPTPSSEKTYDGRSLRDVYLRDEIGQTSKFQGKDFAENKKLTYIHDRLQEIINSSIHPEYTNGVRDALRVVKKQMK
jgi:hypothetical protein